MKEITVENKTLFNYLIKKFE